MRKGAIFADIFDSPETIKQAESEGFHLCSDAEKKVREEDGEREVKRRGRPPKEDKKDEPEPTPEPTTEPIPEPAQEPKETDTLPEPEIPERHTGKKRGIFGGN
jgi:hypothetical protein